MMSVAFIYRKPYIFSEVKMFGRSTVGFDRLLEKVIVSNSYCRLRLAPQHDSHLSFFYLFEGCMKSRFMYIFIDFFDSH